MCLKNKRVKFLLSFVNQNIRLLVTANLNEIIMSLHIFDHLFYKLPKICTLYNVYMLDIREVAE